MSGPMSLRTLLEGWFEFAPGAPEAAVRVDGLALDAATIAPGQAHVAVESARGQRVDAVRRAVGRGAAAVLHDGAAALPPLPVPVLAIRGLESRLAELGARFHRHPATQLTLAGVAGARGKTSTTHFIAQSWRRAGGGAGAISDLGCESMPAARGGRPAKLDDLALQGVLADCVRRGAERAVLEFSPRLFDPAAAADLGFEALAFTCSEPGRATRQASGDAEWLRLFTEGHPRFAVVNHDDPAGKMLSRRIANGTQVLTYGTNGATELRGSVLGMDASGMTVRIAGPWGGGELRTGLFGAHNLANLLAAAGVLALLGMPWNQVMHQVEIMQAAPGRLDGLGGAARQPVVVLDEASSPAALEHALTALRSHLHGRLVCVFGCDATQAPAERRAMAAAAGSLSDRVVMTVGDAGRENPWAIFEDMAQGLRRLDDVRVIEDRAEAIRSAIEESAAGDIVLVAGRDSAGWAGAVRGDAATVRGLLEEAA
jgi:UDP-N-acetylmuramoyl-L-alanyl-D-glutamate--2,6-diaminopimelate ligase